MKVSLSYIFLLVGLLFSCKKTTDSYQFQLLEASQTGIDFANDIVPTNDQNVFSYMYFYNGSGVGAGDFNNDGLVDLFFAANMKENKLYLNSGNLAFKDVTENAFRKEDKVKKGWTNGVSVVDINQDGLLDIYLSQVGGFEKFQAHNLLFICKEITKEGIPIYEEKAAEFGLDLFGLATQAAFFDYDLDGDLDMFQLNHSLHQNGTFGRRASFRGKTNLQAGDRFFRNDNGKFTEITQHAAILDDVLGYGLGVSLGDVNFDGYPDMYIGNDFHENDYLYINQKNGVFKEDLENEINHTSKFSMGVDIGDINNDIFPEIVSLDMLPYDKEILKRSEGDDSYHVYKYKLSWGYNNQFARNNLQLNNRNNTFSEIGQYANIFATDWSWSPLWVDFDNDGQKDLFVSNGIPKRVNDLDYLMFISDAGIQQRLNNKEFGENDKLLIDKLPEIKIPNKFFQNNTTLQFTDIEDKIKNNKVSYSNGAIYADLDNDGDLDIITNNINDKAFIYENLANKNQPNHRSITLHLKGDAKNKNAVGTKCLVFKGKDVISFEKFQIRGFQSSAEIPLTIGIGQWKAVDSVLVIWPDNRFEKIKIDTSKTQLKLTYNNKLPFFDYEKTKQKLIETVDFEDITQASNLNFTHLENDYNEFDQSALLTNLLSSEGPALATADINHDGLEDVFLGGASGNEGKLFIQNTNGKFVQRPQPAFLADKEAEDVDAEFADINQDSHLDLVVASGGNQFASQSENLRPRIYLNDGKGNFKRNMQVFSNLFINASSVKIADFTNDGFPDLLLTARLVPFKYGITPASYLLKNDGKGMFTDITSEVIPELKTVGMIKNAEVIDLDKDKDVDILLASDWGNIILFENKKGKFEKKALNEAKGWWNFTKTYDFDNDGDLDILAGNLGLNNRFKPTLAQPIHLYVNDFDKNGTTDQVFTYFLQNNEVLFASKTEAEKQFPFIKKQFIFAKDFAKATIPELLGEENIKSGQVLSADYLANCLFENDGNGNFILKQLPFEAQFSPYYTAEIMDINNDKLADILLLGNFYDCNIQMGRYDADYGSLFINKGKNVFEKQMLGDILIKGQVKRSKTMMVNQEKTIIIAKNNEAVQLIKPKKK